MNTLLTGDALSVLRTLPATSMQMCVTSPPYWGLRDYGVPGQLGAERTPLDYVAKLVAIFAEVRRVLRDDGTLWLNLGDCYINAKGRAHGADPKQRARRFGLRPQDASIRNFPGLKPKDLVGVPWRVAFALQDDGWYLRSDIVWEKPNAMPDSVTDRPTKSHEYIFLLSKSRRYHYDGDAVREPSTGRASGNRERKTANGRPGHRPADHYGASIPSAAKDTRQRRTVWTIPTKPYKGAHFAVFPPELPRLCILAGSRAGDTVLDPFAGSGTTCAVAKLLGRHFIGIELNEEYMALAEQRIARGA